ncbi:MAG: hypothetical protein U0984_08860 [Prosthecobacter sp.]|nr:hypothetical protein [Prosthecobacter sp.]
MAFLSYFCIMLIDTLPEVKSLSPAQKYELAGELWDEVTTRLQLFEPHPDVLDLLEARDRDWEARPETAVSWEELQAKLGKH